MKLIRGILGFRKAFPPLGCALTLCLLLCAATALRAEQDEDLELIPDNVLSQSPEESVTVAPEYYRYKLYLDEAASVNIKRDDLAVPLPSGEVPSWDNRLSLDLRAEMSVSSNLSLVVADRLNHLLNDDPELAGGRLQNDLKELYATANSYSFLYLDIGRINFKNGVALGFNPTDYFKKNAVSLRVSEDPSVLRENRLGALMVRAQGIWDQGAVALALAPEVNQDSGQWWTDAGSCGLRMERTNSHSRFLTKISLNLLPDFNPELLYYLEEDRSNFGAGLTKGLGNDVIVYVEWSGSNRPDIAAQSLAEAVESGAIPPAAWTSYVDTETHFRNQLAVGFSYTEQINRTTHVEYHFNEAGFSHEDWVEWFETGNTAELLLQHPATRDLADGILGLLWTPRKWSLEAQEPLSRHSLFLRTQWQDALTVSLDLTAMARINPSDGSFFVQPKAEYHIRKDLTLNLSSNLFIGSRESEYGSLNPLGDITAGATWYF
ncbi:MAG: hypothetical protein ACOZF0_19815 [Thermodesulfobacteriota bacterium]